MSFFYCGKFSDVDLATEAWECAKEKDAPELLMHITQEMKHKALDVACWVDNSTIVEFLLEKCKGLNMLENILLAVDFDGDTALHNACLEGATQSVMKLLEAVNEEQDIKYNMMLCINNNGLTAYSTALKEKKNETAGVLLDGVPKDVMEKIKRPVENILKIK